MHVHSKKTLGQDKEKKITKSYFMFLFCFCFFSKMKYLLVINAIVFDI